MPPRLLLLDNYDSFTFNLAQGLATAGASVEVLRNDAVDVSAIVQRRAEIDGLVLSPGPGRPEDAGICPRLLTVLKTAAPDWPLLGVCLGHQLIGQAFGAAVVRAAMPLHGKIWPIHATLAGLQDPLWKGLPPILDATRYHSLLVADQSLPSCLCPLAYSREGDLMALRHRHRPLWGVQFHPESIGTTHGAGLLRNFVTQVGLTLSAA